MSDPTDPTNPEDEPEKTPGWGPAVERALDSVVGIRTEVPEDAFTAGILGTERAGHGALIGDGGIAVTIGYLVTEAETVWVTTRHGKALPGHVLGHDQETGFGLVQILSHDRPPGLELGQSQRLNPGDELVMAGLGEDQIVETYMTARQEFAGYWEYVLDAALFTAPAHPQWGGAALLGADGRLVGIGSLKVEQVTPKGDAVDGNMSVPVELLGPLLEDLERFGQPNRTPRPWLGFYVAEADDGGLVVAGVAHGAPAHEGGVRPGDRIITCAGHAPDELAQLFRGIWSLGAPGVTVPLTVERDTEMLELSIRSAARTDFLKGPQVH